MSVLDIFLETPGNFSVARYTTHHLKISFSTFTKSVFDSLFAELRDTRNCQMPRETAGLDHVIAYASIAAFTRQHRI